MMLLFFDIKLFYLCLIITKKSISDFNLRLDEFCFLNTETTPNEVVSDNKIYSLFLTNTQPEYFVSVLSLLFSFHEMVYQ